MRARQGARRSTPARLRCYHAVHASEGSDAMPAEDPAGRIRINVETAYLDGESVPEENRYVFAYTVTIHNDGDIPARLVTRYWRITDANGKVQEVRGEGVVGEQPYLRPGEGFQYTSGAQLETSMGTMNGQYGWIDDSGTRFEAPIPEFLLTTPRVLH